QSGPAHDLPGEGTGPVAQHDLVVVLADDVEVAADAPLHVDKYRGVRLPTEAGHSETGPVGLILLIADSLTANTDEAACFVEAEDVLKRAGEFAQQAAHEGVACERDWQIRKDLQRGHGSSAHRVGAPRLAT